jgi:fatty-acyl-CoA synthase
VAALIEKHWATIWETVADAIPDADALVQGERRLSWRAYEDRAARLAAAFQEAGLGAGSKVALYLYNSPEYAESYFASVKIRAVPVNVNYRYLDDELLYLLDNSEAEALIFHSSLGDRVERVVAKTGRLRVLIEVDDDGSRLEDAIPYEDVMTSFAPAARQRRDGDDVSMLYTGGTTGMPKGVMTRIGAGVDALLSAVPPLIGMTRAAEPTEVASIAARLADEDRRPVSLPACPLMHGTGLTIGMLPAMLFGGNVALLEGRRFDIDELWATVERERVTWMAIVGDAFARPMLRRLREVANGGAISPTWDLSSLTILASAGAMFSSEIRAGLIDVLPRLVIIDYIGASEGAMGAAISVAGAVAMTGRFTPGPGVKVFTDDDLEVVPASEEAGRVAVANGVPDGYFKDERQSGATFRVIDGTRYSIPGDWATVEADGSIMLLGRGSQCINTGGEKVFPEEVEESVKRQSGIDDCLVFGVPDERFGQRVVAIASCTPGSATSAEAVLDAVRTSLAAYKVPRTMVLVPTVPRLATGKADYASARDLFNAAADERVRPSRIT